MLVKTSSLANNGDKPKTRKYFDSTRDTMKIFFK